MEDFLAELDHAREQRRTSGEHDSRREKLFEPAAPQLGLREGIELLDPRLDHFGEHLPRELARATLADAGDFDDVVRIGELPQRAAVAQLQFLGLLGRRPQRHRDIVGDLIAGDRDHRGMPDRAACEHREIGRAAADIHQAHAQLLLVVVQDRQRRGERLQHHVPDFEPASAYAFGDVLDRGDCAGDDMNLHLQPHAAHA